MKFIKYLSILITCALLFTMCNQAKNSDATTESSFKIAMDHAKVWDEAIKQVMELADAMPDSMISYKPHDSVRTFAEQLIHIGGSSKVICDLYLKDVPPPSQNPDMDANAMTKEEIKKWVSEQMSAVKDSILTMSDEALQEEITSFGGNKMSRLEGMLTVHDHMTNHKAKANLYVRISGNQPPSYRYY